MGVNFECVSDASSALRGNDRGPATGEGVKNDPTVRGDVTHGIGDQSDRLDSGVHGECFVTVEPPPLSLQGLPARAACFVSLKTADGALRGCIGSVQSMEPDLPREVVRNAIDAATADPRFPPVAAEELSGIVYSVDVLGDPEPVEGLDDLDPRRYGVIVENERRRGLLLPDIEGVDSAEEQVAIARGKALIEPDEPVEMWRFEVRRLA